MPSATWPNPKRWGGEARQPNCYLDVSETLLRQCAARLVVCTAVGAINAPRPISKLMKYAMDTGCLRGPQSTHRWLSPGKPTRLWGVNQLGAVDEWLTAYLRVLPHRRPA